MASRLLMLLLGTLSYPGGVAGDVSDAVLAGAVVGTFAGSVLLGVMLAVVGCWCYTKRRRQRPDILYQNNSPGGPVDDAELGRPTVPISVDHQLPVNHNVSPSSPGVSDAAAAAADGAVPITVSLLSNDPDSGLGFDVTGDQTGAIFVRDVFEQGPATQTGRIRPGDRLLSLTVSTVTMELEDALTMLSYSTPYPVQLSLLPAAAATATSPTGRRSWSLDLLERRRRRERPRGDVPGRLRRSHCDARRPRSSPRGDDLDLEHHPGDEPPQLKHSGTEIQPAAVHKSSLSPAADVSGPGGDDLGVELHPIQFVQTNNEEPRHSAGVEIQPVAVHKSSTSPPAGGDDLVIELHPTQLVYTTTDEPQQFEYSGAEIQPSAVQKSTSGLPAEQLCVDNRRVPVTDQASIIIEAVKLETAATNSSTFTDLCSRSREISSQLSTHSPDGDTVIVLIPDNDHQHVDAVNVITVDEDPAEQRPTKTRHSHSCLNRNTSAGQSSDALVLPSLLRHHRQQQQQQQQWREEKPDHTAAEEGLPANGADSSEAGLQDDEKQVSISLREPGKSHHDGLATDNRDSEVFYDEEQRSSSTNPQKPAAKKKRRGLIGSLVSLLKRRSSAGERSKRKRTWSVTVGGAVAYVPPEGVVTVGSTSEAQEQSTKQRDRDTADPGVQGAESRSQIKAEDPSTAAELVACESTESTRSDDVTSGSSETPSTNVSDSQRQEKPQQTATVARDGPTNDIRLTTGRYNGVDTALESKSPASDADFDAAVRRPGFDNSLPAPQKTVVAVHGRESAAGSCSLVIEENNSRCLSSDAVSTTKQPTALNSQHDGEGLRQSVVNEAPVTPASAAGVNQTMPLVATGDQRSPESEVEQLRYSIVVQPVSIASTPCVVESVPATAATAQLQLVKDERSSPGRDLGEDVIKVTTDSSTRRLNSLDVGNETEPAVKSASGHCVVAMETPTTTSGDASYSLPVHDDVMRSTSEDATRNHTEVNRKRQLDGKYCEVYDLAFDERTSSPNAQPTGAENQPQSAGTRSPIDQYVHTLDTTAFVPDSDKESSVNDTRKRLISYDAERSEAVCAPPSTNKIRFRNPTLVMRGDDSNLSCVVDDKRTSQAADSQTPRYDLVTHVLEMGNVEESKSQNRTTQQPRDVVVRGNQLPTNSADGASPNTELVKRNAIVRPSARDLTFIVQRQMKINNRNLTIGSSNEIGSSNGGNENEIAASASVMQPPVRPIFAPDYNNNDLFKRHPCISRTVSAGQKFDITTPTSATTQHFVIDSSRCGSWQLGDIAVHRVVKRGRRRRRTGSGSSYDRKELSSVDHPAQLTAIEGNGTTGPDARDYSAASQMSTTAGRSEETRLNSSH